MQTNIWQDNIDKYMQTREIKAKKIESVLSNFLNISSIKNKTILEIGCGRGGIVKYFSRHNKMYAVDLYDHITDSIPNVYFNKVNTESLPYEDKKFDIIITNHVIEHIKGQNLHLEEIRRCLKDDGICYFSTPNKNFLIEPHYKIPLIHYFGNFVFHKFLKLIKKYKEDLFLLSYLEMKQLFRNHHFQSYEYTVKVLKYPDIYYLEKKYLKKTPLFFLNFIKYFAPTNIFILKKKK